MLTPNPYALIQLPPRLEKLISLRFEHIDLVQEKRDAQQQKPWRERNVTRPPSISVRTHTIWQDPNLPLVFTDMDEAESLLSLYDDDDVNAPPVAPNKQEDAAVTYWKIKNNMYKFKYGKDEYLATMVELPTRIEMYQPTDFCHVDKYGDVKRMLIVHDTPGSSHPKDRVWAHGLHPLLKNIGPKREMEISAHARRNEFGVSIKQVQQVDRQLFDLAAYIQQYRHPSSSSTSSASEPFLINKEEEEVEVVSDEEMTSHPPKKKGKSSAKAAASQAPPPGGKKKKIKLPKKSSSSSKKSTYVYEEVVPAEAWMALINRPVIVVQMGTDHFKSSVKALYQEARDNFLALEKKQRQYEEAQQKAREAPPTSYLTQFPMFRYLPPPPPSAPALGGGK